MTASKVAKVEAILRPALLALRYVQAMLGGLPACNCGRYQWDGAGWITKNEVGDGYTDEYEGEPISAGVCFCGCYCGPGGIVERETVAAAETAPHVPTSIGGEEA